MADNTLTNAIPQLLAQGLLALRENCIMPRIVNSTYSSMAGEKGSTIDIPVPEAMDAVEVTPGVVIPANTGYTPTLKSLPMDQWYEAAFPMSDKNYLELQSGFLPKQASEAVKSLANQVDTHLLGMYKYFYTYVGTAGTTPFGNFASTGTIEDAVECYYKLNQNLTDMDDRFMVLSPISEGAALMLEPFHNASFGGGATAIPEGELNQKIGFRWLMDQNVVTHTAGTKTGDPDVKTGGAAIGASSIPVETDSGDALALKHGDVISFSGNATTWYTVAADLTLAASESGNVTLQSPLTTAVAETATINITASHSNNLAIQRNAIAFATRPLAASDHPGSIIRSAVDPISGLTLRLEVTRQHKQDRFSYDILWGAAVVRPEFGVRLYGAV